MHEQAPEKFPQNAQEHPTDAEIIKGLKENESSLVEKAVAFFRKMSPENVMSKPASLFLAFSLFAMASSAFASEQGADSISLPSMGENVAEQAVEKNNAANFDWSTIVKKVEIPVGGIEEHLGEFKGESIEAAGDRSSQFYSGMSSGEEQKVLFLLSSSIYSSQNAEDFVKNITAGVDGFTNMQKAMLIQQLGARLAGTYNYDMLNSNTHVAVSQDVMLQALKDGSVSGICGNIHDFMSKIAESMGVEAFLQTGATGGGDHVWMGMILGSGSERQIVFADYNTLVPTGTLNYKDALGVMERYHKTVSVFNNYVSDEKGKTFQVKSRASEVMQKAAGVENPADILAGNLHHGEISKKEAGVQINISPTTKQINLSTGTVGLVVTDLSYTHFEDAENPYQSISSMNAFAGSVGLHGENFGAKIGVAALNTDIKTMSGETLPSSELIATLMADAVGEHEFTKGSWGQFVVKMGATIVGAVSAGSERDNLPDGEPGGMGEGSAGVSVVYINPDKTGSFHIDATTKGIISANNLVEQQLVVQGVANNIALGAEVTVREGTVVNMEIKKGNLDWGTSLGIDAGVKSGNMSANISAEQKTSDYKTITPSSRSVGVGVGYQVGPKFKIEFVGSKTIQQYQGGSEQGVAEAKVRTVFVW